MNVTVFGIGYVGLVQAAVLSEVGNHVCCVAVDKGKNRKAQARHYPYLRAGLNALSKVKLRSRAHKIYHQRGRRR